LFEGVSESPSVVGARRLPFVNRLGVGERTQQRESMAEALLETHLQTVIGRMAGSIQVLHGSAENRGRRAREAGEPGPGPTAVIDGQPAQVARLPTRDK